MLIGCTRIADDLLIGCAAIAQELGIDERRCFHWLQHKFIPAVKTGAIWTASRRALRRHFESSADTR